jgi:hypothetical protein
MKLEWKLLIAIIERITKWLDEHFSARARQKKKATDMKDEAIEKKDKSLLQAACERLRRLRKK